MRKIDTLIFRAVVSPFLITLSVLTFIVFVGKIGSWSKLIISNNAALETFGIISIAIIPTILIFSLPISFLIGILIGISGLNGESQITALRACGVPVRRLFGFILFMGIFVGGLTALMSIVVVPRMSSFLTSMKAEILLTQAPTQLLPRVFNDSFENTIFYLEDISPDKKKWSRIFMARDADTKTPSLTLAKTGIWLSVKEDSTYRLQLHLEDGARYTVDLEHPGEDDSTAFTEIDIPITLDESQIERSGDVGQPRKASEMKTSELIRLVHDPSSDNQEAALIELQQRIALPFSVFPFALVGLTLAVNTQKGGRTSGFAISLGIVLLFYFMFVNGIRLAKIGEVNPWIGPWAADILLLFLGLILLVKTESSSRSDSWFSANRWKHGWEKLGARYHMQHFQSALSRLDNRMFQALSNLFRFFFPKVFDLYIAKGFISYFIWSLITCGMLFMLFTLFEMLDDVIRNGRSPLLVIEYFVFLTPQVVVVAIPMSVLLGVLINFGILEKNSEVTAMKAGGWSLYRISIPVFVLAGIFSVGLFLIQDYILPTSNEHQDRIWSSIKGRPPRATMQTRKWILGESGRIYNYEHFDEQKDAFIGLNIYETDLESSRILSILRASRASINADGEWVLKNGWLRDYGSEKDSFRKFQTETFRFPEKADYFKKEIFQPTESSKMTYRELMSHINYLMKSGYNAVELQVELRKKIAFPFSCLVMAMLAIPFSFIIGKRGAFFGIGASIAIAIIYMMIMGLFESMGSYGILTPFLAAWAPNLIFGAAGFWMILSIRT